MQLDAWILAVRKHIRATPAMVCTAAIMLTAVTPAQAWNDCGHMTAALLAHRRLDAATRAKAVAILKAAFDGPNALPNFADDLTRGLPPNATEAERDLFIFMKAATWPDIIRDTTHPANARFHKGPWHYIDLPYVAPGDATPLPPNPTPTPAGQEPGDALSAIELCLADVKNAATPADIRAARLCFLMHIIGDIHQPLHCAAQFSDDRLKRGDQGGNLQLVRRPGPGVSSLHEIFDGLLGRETRLRELIEFVEQLESNPLHTEASLASTLAQGAKLKWIEEGLAEAIEWAYLKGTIKTHRGTSAKKFRDANMDPSLVPPMPDGYETNARPMAERRIVVAGARLAGELRQCLP